MGIKCSMKLLTEDFTLAPVLTKCFVGTEIKSFLVHKICRVNIWV